MTTNKRADLGEFMHAVCFQYLRLYTEEVTGRAPVVAAGRKRGYDVIESLGLLNSSTNPQLIHARLDETLGAKGTRLCEIQHIEANPNGSYTVHIHESACTMNQTSSEPFCAFTLGVFIGAIHAFTGIRMTGHETECQACGAASCIYQIEPV